MSVDEQEISRIGAGIVVLLGVGASDRAEDGERLGAKIASLRIFPDDRGRLHHTLAESGGAALVVPQFTLYGDIRAGRRPDFATAAPPDVGERLYEAFCGVLRGVGLTVAQGRFGASMRIAMEADGPVTIVATTDGWREAELG